MDQADANEHTPTRSSPNGVAPFVFGDSRLWAPVKSAIPVSIQALESLEKVNGVVGGRRWRRLEWRGTGGGWPGQRPSGGAMARGEKEELAGSSERTRGRLRGGEGE